MHRLALILITTVLLTGCGWLTPKVEYRTEYRVFDEVWLVPCNILPPPDKEIYRTSSERARALLWAQVYMDQVKELHACRARLGAAQTYNQYLRDQNRRNAPQISAP